MVSSEFQKLPLILNSTQPAIYPTFSDLQILDNDTICFLVKHSKTDKLKSGYFNHTFNLPTLIQPYQSLYSLLPDLLTTRSSFHRSDLALIRQAHLALAPLLATYTPPKVTVVASQIKSNLPTRRELAITSSNSSGPHVWREWECHVSYFMVSFSTICRCPL